MIRDSKNGNAFDLVQIQGKLDQSPEKRVWRGLDQLAGCASEPGPQPVPPGGFVVWSTLSTRGVFGWKKCAEVENLRKSAACLHARLGLEEIIQQIRGSLDRDDGLLGGRFVLVGGRRLLEFLKRGNQVAQVLADLVGGVIGLEDLFDARKPDTLALVRAIRLFFSGFLRPGRRRVFGCRRS